MSNIYPIGTIVPYSAGININNENALISAGFIPCDGRGLQNSNPSYQDLFKVIGETYGATDTEFYIPDYQGRFLRGTDLGAGRDPDAKARSAPRPDLPKKGNTKDAVGSIQPDGLISHSHQYSVHTGNHHCNYGSLIGPGVYKEGDFGTELSGATGEDETRPINSNINFLIVYK